LALFCSASTGDLAVIAAYHIGYDFQVLRLVRSLKCGELKFTPVKMAQRDEEPTNKNNTA
jgi:hypothetical protein